MICYKMAWFPQKLTYRHPFHSRRNSALIPANAGLFHYAGNNPVHYIDPDGRLQRNAQNQLQAKQFAQIKTKDGTIYDVFLLKQIKKEQFLDLGM